MTFVATSSQTIGPFFREGLIRPEWSDLTRDGVRVEPVRIFGTMTDGDGAAVPDGMVEIWQADENGRYPHPEDEGRTTRGRLFRGFGRSCTDAEGRFWFRTIVPGAVAAAAGSTPQAPHVNVSVFARGLLKRAVTRLYFGDRVEENARDPLLSSISDEAARRTMIATREEHDGGAAVYRFDIVLQGPNETAFLRL